MESSIIVAAPADEVFRVLSDVRRWPEWTGTVTTLERLDPGPLAVGSRARIKQPKLRRAVWEVTEFEPDHSFTWVSTSPGIVTTGRHTVEAAGDGAVVMLSIEHSGPLSVLAGLLTKRLTQLYLAREGQGLKRLCERRPPAA